MPTTSSSTFPLFPQLCTELRLKIWQFACSPRVIPVLYNPSLDICLSPSPPPAILAANRESRDEALRFYSLCFGTRSNPAHIYFNPYRDTLYLPRFREMGYDETLRDFSSYLTNPELLECVRCLALDHVNIEVKRPWESYNKASLIRCFPALEEIVLVLCDGGEENGGDILFTEPKKDPETILRMWVNFRQTFVMEQKLLEEVARDMGKECSGYSLPTVRLKAKIERRRMNTRDCGVDEFGALTTLRVL